MEEDTFAEDKSLLNRENNTESNFQRFRSSFSELSSSPREYWIVVLMIFLSQYAISLFLIPLSIYLSEVLDLSDMVTGLLFVAFGVLALVFSFLLGYFADRFHTRTNLFTCGILMIANFVVLLVVPLVAVKLVAIILFLPIIVCIFFPTTKLAVKRYTEATSRSLGFSFFYMAYYTGAALSGITVDLVISLNGTEESTFVLLFLIDVGIITVFIGLVFLLRQDSDLETDFSMWEHTKEVLESKTFWKFMGLAMLFVIVKSVQKHADVTLPIYMYRDIEEDAHFGYMQALANITILVSIPATTYLIYFFTHYSLLVLGSFVSSLSVIPLLFGASYWTVAAFIVVVSVGEGITSPRLADYTLQVAKEGKEGVFLSLAAAPLHVSTVVTGIMAGALLSKYCPEDGERECWALWGLIGLVAIVPSFLMLVFRPYLEEKPVN